MRTLNKNSRLPLNKKTGKVIPASPKFHNIPSDKIWQKCISNLQFLFSDAFCDDENLSVNEQIKQTKQELRNLKYFPSLIFQVINIVADKKRTLENRLIQLNETAEINSEDLNGAINSNSITGMKRIPIDGKSCDFAIKAGIFFFNPNYKNGLHLSKVYLEFITGLLCEIFYHSNGKVFSYKYIYTNILVGANKKPDIKK